MSRSEGADGWDLESKAMSKDMKVKTTNQSTRAFTLIEMIGVLAVIAILAAVLVPKVFEAINNSRINNASMSCDTVKTAVADHYSKYGGLNVDGSVTPSVTISAFPDNVYDLMLLKEQFLDKPFALKIGDGINGVANTHVALTTCPALGTTVGATAASELTTPTGYALSGTTNVNECTGSYIVEAVITGVSGADAQALSQRIDGNNMSAADALTADFAGRVKYAAPVSGLTTVYVYLTHR